MKIWILQIGLLLIKVFPFTIFRTGNIAFETFTSFTTLFLASISNIVDLRNAVTFLTGKTSIAPLFQPYKSGLRSTFGYEIKLIYWFITKKQRFRWLWNYSYGGVNSLIDFHMFDMSCSEVHQNLNNLNLNKLHLQDIIYSYMTNYNQL